MPLSDDQRGKIETIPAIELTGLYYRQQTPSRHEPLGLPAIAREGARWHRPGDPWPAYAGDSPEAVMAEMLRYVEVEPGEPLVLPTKRLSDLHVSQMRVIDIANPLALDYLELTEKELTAGHGDDPESEICRELADQVRASRPEVEGLLVPSAALSGARVLVIFPQGFDRVAVGDQRVVKLAIMPAPPPKPAPRPPS